MRLLKILMVAAPAVYATAETLARARYNKRPDLFATALAKIYATALYMPKTSVIRLAIIFRNSRQAARSMARDGARLSAKRGKFTSQSLEELLDLWLIAFM